MPESYGVDRTATGMMLTWTELTERMALARNYWVCSTRPDGRPHAAPVWGLWMEEAFFFSTDPTSRKGQNLTARPDVVVHLESGDDVAIIEGQVERVTDAPLIERLSDAYEKKYAIRLEPSNPSYGIYVVRPRAAYGWAERDFLATATRWKFDSK